jgi:hypothetical protein
VKFFSAPLSRFGGRPGIRKITCSDAVRPIRARGRPDRGSQALKPIPDERNTLLFQDRAKLPKVTRVDTNVNVCGRYFIRSVLADVFDQFEERLARLVTIPTRPTSTFRASLACRSFT